MIGGKIYTIKIKTEKLQATLLEHVRNRKSYKAPPKKTPKNPFNLTLKPPGIETF